jgi:serine/threonine-protein kinase
LEELLKPPHKAVFTVDEAIKLAQHLSSALAHCHRAGVKHGDIKSNNVKYNIHTKQYMLLDFGLAVLSDEQRRTSLRQAGAIEFMAPEQSEGKVLFETDIYSLGVILFEVLAGVVPFPLSDRSEAARNRVMLAHMETTPPDILPLRKQYMDDASATDDREVPGWLLELVGRCLQKDPGQRFGNGEDVQRFVQASLGKTVATILAQPPAPQPEWLEEKRLLQQQLHQQQQQLDEMRRTLLLREREISQLKSAPPPQVETYATPERRGINPAAFYTLLIIAGLLAAFAAYSFFRNGSLTQGRQQGNLQTTSDTQTVTEQRADTDGRTNNLPAPKEPTTQEDTAPATQQPAVVDEPKRTDTAATNPPETTTENRPTENAGTGSSAKRYTVKERAYFHNEPDEGTRRNAFIVHWNNAVLTPLDETDEFIYVVFTNEKGQTSKGWLRKKDLEEAQ